MLAARTLFSSRIPWVAGHAALALLALACGASPNTLRLVASADAQLASPRGFRELLAHRGLPRAILARERDGSAMAIGGNREELIAARLERAQSDARAWRQELPLTTPPALAQGIVAAGRGDQVELFELESGHELRTLPAHGGLLLAASVDAGGAALLLDRRGGRELSVYEGTRERLRITAPGLGAPALLGDTLLVPWGEGYVSAVDVVEAEELARIRAGEQPLHAREERGVLYFGGPPWVELGSLGDLPAPLPRRPLPGPFESGPIALGPGGNASAEVQPTHLFLPLTPAAESGVYMATYGRIAFGLEREHGTLEWVVALPGRVLAALPVESGFLLCDDSGGVRLLADDSGQLQRQWTLARQRRSTLGERPLGGCALAGGEVLGADAKLARQKMPPLLEQLERVLDVSDPGLTEAQRFLARELAARPEPEATRVLIELVTRHSLDRVLQSEAEDLLATRRNGVEYMLEALAPARADELALPPIAALGEALAALHETRAAASLARQLNRPAHEAQALARAAAALEELASEAEYAELSVFFSLHRTTADGPESVAAVVSIARTLLRIGGQKAQAMMEFARRDPLTVSDVRSAIDAALGPRPPEGGPTSSIQRLSGRP